MSALELPEGYTPGPWRAALVSHLIPELAYDVESGLGRHIAMKASESNARLIALAPAMAAEIRRLEAEIVKLRATRAGWRLAPVEPTDDMIDALREELIVVAETGIDIDTGDQSLCWDLTRVEDGYRAMLRAAPAEPLEGETPDLIGGGDE